MWHISALFVSAIFAIAWGVQPQLSIVLHEGAKLRSVSSHLNVEEGTTITLICTSKPHQLSATHDLVWQEIGSSSYTTNNELSFQPIRLEDEGEYLCFDKKGNRYKRVKINVQPKEKRNDRQLKGGGISPPALEALYNESQKLANVEKNNPQSKNWDALINVILGVISKNEHLIENLTAIALEELKSIEKPKTEESAEPEHVELSTKSGMSSLEGGGEVGSKQKNFVELTLSPADEDFLHEEEEGYVNANHLESPVNKEVDNEKTETTTENEKTETTTKNESLKEEEEATEATTTEASSDEYNDEEEYYSEEEEDDEEEEEENEKKNEEEEEEEEDMDDLSENQNDEEEEEEEEEEKEKKGEEGSTTKQPSYENETTETGKPNKYTVEKENSESAESKEIEFPDHEPKELFNRFGESETQTPEQRRHGGLNAIYSDYFEEPSNNENESEAPLSGLPPKGSHGKEEETVTVKETSTYDINLLNKLKPYLNKHLGRKHPAEMPLSTEASSSNSEEPMQLAVNEINSEVKDMAVFKYIVGAILLVLVILLLAFIIRIWHLLEFKVSHDSPLPPQQYVPLIASAGHAEADDATETLLP